MIEPSFSASPSGMLQPSMWATPSISVVATATATLLPSNRPQPVWPADFGEHRIDSRHLPRFLFLYLEYAAFLVVIYSSAHFKGVQNTALRDFRELKTKCCLGLVTLSPIKSPLLRVAECHYTTINPTATCNSPELK